MAEQHERWMNQAIAEGELARGHTGDNPWVGCVIVSADGQLLGRGHTQGPGEDHAEIAAAREAHAKGHSVVGATLYSTLEPCAFHGRTPACAHSIAEREIARVVIGMHDPHPRVNGRGVAILREAGVEVVLSVCEAAVRRQLGQWVLTHHPHDVRRRAASAPASAPSVDAAGGGPSAVAQWLSEVYGVERAQIEALLATS